MSVDALLGEVAACAIRTLGFRSDALEPYVLARTVRRLRAGGSSDRELAERCRRDERDVARVIAEEVTVAETYFFRNPEQFELLARLAADHCVASKTELVRAWSAGCANGAEAYSLAATLRASVPDHVEVRVLGTDAVERNIMDARAGCYGPWAVRESGPLIFDALVRAGDQMRVAQPVRSLVHFEVRNLLDEPPDEGPFDFVFCRSVLLYLGSDALERVWQRLVAALLPGGVLFLGPGDLVQPPACVVSVGHPKLHAYSRKQSREGATTARALRERRGKAP